MGLGHVGEHRGREPVALVGELARTRVARRALALAERGELLDAGQLGGRIDRSHVGVLVHRVTDTQLLHATDQSAKDFVGDRLLHEEPRTGATNVTLVEEDPVNDAFDHLVNRSVFEDNVCALAAEFEGESLLT